MRVQVPTESIAERHRKDNLNAKIEQLQSIIDYNIMMEAIEDPAEDTEEGEEDVT